MTAEATTAAADRTAQMTAFVREAGRDPQTLEALTADASSRRYLRLKDGKGRALLLRLGRLFERR